MTHYAPTLSIFYRIFFLYIEPFFSIIGAYYAYFSPSTYLYLTHPVAYSSDSFVVPIATRTTLAQLANLYLLFGINEALVLRAAYEKGRGYNLNVWRVLLFGLLVADLGHLWSVRETGTGWDVYVNIMGWNSMAWGNVGFVYDGMAMRLCFLSGIGLG